MLFLILIVGYLPLLKLMFDKGRIRVPDLFLKLITEVLQMTLAIFPVVPGIRGTVRRKRKALDWIECR